jgi:outer membrane protein OmpA-like peptidoglycan-associated protein
MRWPPATRPRWHAARPPCKANALERDLQALQAQNTQRGMVVTLGDVLFDTGKASLQPGAQRSVAQLATVLKQYPERRVLIEGFTDNVGPESLNLELSRRRAEAFQRALQSAGVPQVRMETQARGEADPVANNATPAGRQQNRRIEVVFSDAQGQFSATAAPSATHCCAARSPPPAGSPR